MMKYIGDIKCRDDAVMHLDSISPGYLRKVSQMQGPRPYFSVFPSTWYADDAVPKTKPGGKFSLVRL